MGSDWRRGGLPQLGLVRAVSVLCMVLVCSIVIQRGAALVGNSVSSVEMRVRGGFPVCVSGNPERMGVEYREAFDGLFATWSQLSPGAKGGFERLYIVEWVIGVQWFVVIQILKTITFYVIVLLGDGFCV